MCPVAPGASHAGRVESTRSRCVPPLRDVASAVERPAKSTGGTRMPAPKAHSTTEAGAKRTRSGSSPGVSLLSSIGLIADELERRAVQSGDRKAMALGEVDLDHLDVVPLELGNDGRRAGVHDDLARCEGDAVQR